MTKIRLVAKKVGHATPIKDVILDHSDRKVRKWLGKFSYWALRNNISVATCPVGDGEPAEVTSYPGPGMGQDSTHFAHVTLTTSRKMSNDDYKQLASVPFVKQLTTWKLPHE